VGTSRAGSTSLGLKLTMEWIPLSSWNRSLDKLAPRTLWQKVRREAFAKYGERCAICGAKAIHAHECWDYDDATHRQCLKDVILVCGLCHLVKHFSRAELLAKRAKVNLAGVVEHFLTVNHCDLRAFRAHKRATSALWQQRSQYEWTIDFGAYRWPGSAKALRRSKRRGLTFQGKAIIEARRR
jgi:hypothetical protein